MIARRPHQHFCQVCRKTWDCEQEDCEFEDGEPVVCDGCAL